MTVRLAMASLKLKSKLKTEKKVSSALPVSNSRFFPKSWTSERKKKILLSKNKFSCFCSAPLLAAVGDASKQQMLEKEQDLTDIQSRIHHSQAAFTIRVRRVRTTVAEIWSAFGTLWMERNCVPRAVAAKCAFNRRKDIRACKQKVSFFRSVDGNFLSRE